MLLLIVLQIQDSADTLKRKDIFLRSPTKAALMSAIIPGLGQFYNGRKMKGLILGGLSLASLTYTFIKYSEYRVRGDNRSVSEFLGATIINLAVWGYTSADAFVDAYLYGFQAERDTVLEDIETERR
jgi:maltooligosaccharide ABC transporter membrane protein